MNKHRFPWPVFHIRSFHLSEHARSLRLSPAILAVTGMIALGAPALSQTAGETLPWPIDYLPYISSTFGEPRTGRFHYGLDCKSGGVLGKNIFAMGNGYISRVQTSSTGYGKALYVKLDSGLTVVYGHLSGYMPEIEERLVSVRREKKSYDIDWSPSPGEIRVAAGQVIAFSGDSGSWGSPHLHLEIRDAENNALNPLDFGLKVEDTIPPQIHSIVLIPLDSGSTVDGLPKPRWINGSGTPDKPVRLSGRIGIAANAWDMTNNSSNVVGVYDITLSLDKVELFSKRYQELNYTFDGRGSLDYLSGPLYGGSGTISALFRHPGNLLTFYNGTGIIDATTFDGSVKTISIIARDYTGNRVTRTVPVKLGYLPVFTYCGQDGEGHFRIAGTYDGGVIDHVELSKLQSDGSWALDSSHQVGAGECNISIPAPGGRATYRVSLVALDASRSLPAEVTFAPVGTESSARNPLSFTTTNRHDCIMITISSSEPLASVPLIVVAMDSSTAPFTYCPTPVNGTSWTGTIPFGRSGRKEIRVSVSAFDRRSVLVRSESTLDCTVADSFGNNSISSADQRFVAYVPPGSLYRPAPLTIAQEATRHGGAMTQVSGGYRVAIGDDRFRKPLIVHLTVEGDIPDKSALYFRNGTNGNGGWRFLSDERKGTVFTGELAGPGCVAVLCDTAAPAVIPSTPRAGVTLRNSRPQIKVAVRDGGSGLAGSDSIRMLLDGEPIYGEFDPVRGVVSYIPFHPIPSGAHTVSITVTDRVGNTTERTWRFTTAP